MDGVVRLIDIIEQITFLEIVVDISFKSKKWTFKNKIFISQENLQILISKIAKLLCYKFH